mgnify:FL=1
MTTPMDARAFCTLCTYLERVPAIGRPVSHGADENGPWWVKFRIDVDHPLAWRVVQEFGHVLNELSLRERLPTVFKPVSPPPYLNGGPKEYLSWVIECSDGGFRSGTVAKWLEGRLPRPVEDLAHLATLSGARPAWLVAGDETEDLDRLAARVDETMGFWEQFLAEPLDAERTLLLDKDTYECPAAVVAVQALHHANAHREQVRAALRELDGKPLDLQPWEYALDTGRARWRRETT